MDDNFTIPSGVLDDLCSRFIINVPEEERNDLIRIFFQIEIAHWFYLDFHCNENSNLKPCSIRNFADNIFRHCSFLMQHSNQVDVILSKWKVFKHAVPTNGAIILDESLKYVLLVQGFWAKASWGFPKGKIIEEESEMKCAIREVLEETGYDITNQLKPDQYLQIQINEQTIRLYIITNVPRNTNFEPKTRREIKEVRWFAIDELPMHKKDIKSKQAIGLGPNAFFMVIPFIKSLKQWINSHGTKPQQQQQQYSVNNSVKQVTTDIQQNLSLIQQISAKKISPLPVNQQQQQQVLLNKDELRKQKQSQYFNKLNKEEYDELVNCREKTSNKFQKNTNVLLSANLNSKFKPVNKMKLNNVNNQQTTSTIQVLNSSTTPGVINIQPTNANATPAVVSGNINSRSKQSIPTSKSADLNQYHHQHHHHHHNRVNTNRLNTTNQSNENAFKVKKHLDFCGPECWINFKFNYESIFSDLPAFVL